MCFPLLLSTKEDSLNNFGNQTIDFQSILPPYFQNIFIWAQQKNETEQVWRVSNYDRTSFFGLNYPFKL